MSEHKLTRRSLIQQFGIASVGVVLAACQPQVTEVEKEVTKVVEKEVVVKETVEVEKEVTRVVGEPTAAPKEPVTVRYLTWWGEYTTTVLAGIMSAFKDKYPHVDIKVEEVSWGDAPTKYQTTMAAGTCADVIYHKEMMSKFYTSGQILDITDYFQRDGFNYARDFYQTIGSDWWAGKMYGWPHMFEDICVFYNKEILNKYYGKDLWEAFPDGEWTWQDLISIAKTCTVDENGDGKTDIWGVYAQYNSIVGVLEQLAWTMGDSMFDYENMRYNFTSPTVLEGMHLIHDLVVRDGIMIRNEESQEITNAMGVSAAFAAGKTAFHIRATPDVGRFLVGIEDKFEWDCMWLPNWDKNKGVTQAGGHGHCIWSGTKVPDDAYEWVKYMGTEPGLMPMMVNKLTMPCMKRQELTDAFNTGYPDHVNVWLDSLTKRGGHGDHFRHNGYEQCTREFTNNQDLLYAMPYEEGTAQLDAMAAAMEETMNGFVSYGDVKPFSGVTVPIKEL